MQKNKLFIHYLTLIIVVMGVTVLFKMQREARPNVNFNRVNVSVFYPGASPSDIEDLIIDPIEEKIAEVDGLEEFKSISYIGAGAITIKIDQSYPNPQKIIDEIRQKIAEVKDLPLGVDDPVITEAKAENIPVLNLALFGTVSPYNLKLETEKLKDFLELQDGVQSVSYTGMSDLQLRVVADPAKLDKFDITIDEVQEKLSSWTRQKPGGLFENNQYVTSLTIGSDLNELELLGDFVIRSNDAGVKVKLSDVAKLSFDLESIQSGSVFLDEEAVLLTVIKKPFSDSIETVDALNAAIKEYERRLSGGLKIKLYKDQSIRIRDKLKIVTSNAFSGLILVLLILLIFLDWRSALVTSIGIPVAILGGLCVLYAMGQTLNSLVVVGIIIVLGMLVDDAIVVCENIYSYIEKGLSPKEAAFKGTAEIALPVLASVLTTVFAFLPIVFMKEIIGQFLRVIPITVIALLCISLFEALFILPIHAEEVMKVKKNKKESFFKKYERKYEKYLNWSIEKRSFLMIGLILFLAVSGIQGKKLFDKFSLFPAEGLEGFSVRVELPKNTPLEKTKKAVKDLSKELSQVSEGSFENIYSDLGQVTTGGRSGSRQNGSHLAMINVTFITGKSLIDSEKRIINNVRDVVAKYTEGKDLKTSITIDRPGPPIGKPIQLQITSRDSKLGAKIADQLKEDFGKIDGVHSLETDLDGDSVKYRFNIDNELAVSMGVSPEKVAKTIFSASTGSVLNEILKDNEKIEILLTIDDMEEKPVETVLDLKIRNDNGQAVPLNSFVKVNKEKGPSSIQRLNGLRTITLFGEVDDQVITGKEANVLISPLVESIKKENQSVSIETGGGEKDRLNAVTDTLKLYGYAILLIFITISLTFQSFTYPLLVLTAIPMGLGGVVWSLVLHGKSLSIMGIIGIVGLSGVVVNVSILFLKFVQDECKAGTDFREAIIKAGVSRLRPIVMTTVSTLIGLLPTIYGIGGTDTFVQPIALVLGWGLFVATSLTLTCLPAIISFFPIIERGPSNTDSND